MKTKIEVTAECVFVGEVEELGQKKFQKRTFVLQDKEDGENYPTTLAFVLIKERTALVQPSMKGKILSVSGYVESRAWENPKNGKVQYFTEVKAVSVSVADGKNATPEPADPSGSFDNDDSDNMPV